MADHYATGTLTRGVLSGAAIVAIALGVLWLGAASDQRRIERLYQTTDVSVLQSSSSEIAGLADPTLPIYPNTAGRIMEAVVSFRLANPNRSRAILNTVVAREPQNAQAWTLLEIVNRFTDLAGAKRARAKLLGLDPLFGRGQ